MRMKSEQSRKKIEQREIQLGDQKVSYALRRSSRARRLRLTVFPDSTVVVTAPNRSPEGAAERFIRQKAAWLTRKLAHFARFADHLFVSQPIRRKRMAKAEYATARAAARALVEARIAHFNQTYGFSFKKIYIRNQKTRWGSCSSKGNLSFNYRIASLPAATADYIVVHELCHLAEFNHSPRFWALVERAVPDYKAIRRSLKRMLVR